MASIGQFVDGHVHGLGDHVQKGKECQGGEHGVEELMGRVVLLGGLIPVNQISRV